MAAGDVFRLSLLGNDGFRSIVNTFHYADDSGGSVHINADAFCSDWWTTWSAPLLAAAVNSVNFTAVNVQCILGPNLGDIGVYGMNAGNTGTYGAPDVIPEICIAITRKITKAGRKNRGRIFWGPLNSGHFSSVPNGEVNTGDASLTSISTILTSSFTTQTVALDPCLVHAAGKPVVYTRTPGIITESVVSQGSVHRKTRRDKTWPV